MMKYYEIENFDESFETLSKAISTLKKVLDDESNYNYLANKNNTYAILEVLYDEKNYDYNYTEILSSITVAQYKNMNCEEKEKYFNN